MKNFEKYEKQMKEWGGEISLTDSGEVRRCCCNTSCDTCKFGIHEWGETCKDKRVDWLYDDYKKPLLTDAEKNYLRDIIRPFRDEFDYLRIHYDILTVHFTSGSYIDISYLNKLPEEWFKALKQGQAYSLEELGL